MMHGTQNMSKSQRSEMKRRAFQFIHYFIRSPLYELYSSQLITVLLNMVDQRVPGFKLISSISLPWKKIIDRTNLILINRTDQRVCSILEIYLCLLLDFIKKALLIT